MDIFDLRSQFGPISWVSSGIILFFCAERIISFRGATHSLFHRWRINFSLNFFNLAVVDLFFFLIVKRIALFSGEYHLDLYNIFHLNSVTRLIATVIIMDGFTYFWHRLNHISPFLWRFHQVHHTDLNMDVSSAARFHFGEITLSAVLTYSLTLLLGSTMLEVRLFQVILAGFNQFEHSNIKLKPSFEKLLSYVFVQPSMHRIHHSDKQVETDSNYGTILSFWDRIFGTLKQGVDQEKIVFGLKAHKNFKELNFRKLLVMPFKKTKRG